MINNRPDVRTLTRKKVLAAITELGYRPNAAARTMIAGRTHTIGCISPNLVDYTFASIIDGVQDEARSLSTKPSRQVRLMLPTPTRYAKK